MEEESKYEVIKKLVESNGNKKRAALKLNCTQRTINRMIQGYKSYGKEFFIHGNHGRKPLHSFTSEIKMNILDLYRTKYIDANFVHFSELLLKYENILASPSSIRSILMPEFIL